jgi:hypothetical protein
MIPIHAQENLMRSNRVLSVLGLFAVAFLLCACESQSKAPEMPVAAADVKIYKDPPFNQYKVLGLVTLPTGGEVTWGDRGDSTRGFELLREKVAQLGGNGILLKLDPKEYDMQVLAGDRGTYYQVPLKGNPRTVVVQAIRVKE